MVRLLLRQNVVVVFNVFTTSFGVVYVCLVYLAASFLLALYIVAYKKMCVYVYSREVK